MTVSGNANREAVLHPLYAARLWRMGKSLVFPLYEAVIDAIQATPGDLVLVRVHLPYVTFRIAVPDLTMPIPRFGADELPPSYRELLNDIARRIG